MRKTVHAPRHRFLFAASLLTLTVALSASAQGIVGDLLAGKLVDPKAGQWAWYTVTDGDSGRQYAVRQAIVAEESVGRKDGYWLEVEVVPEVGYKTVYKILLTGPASDPKNIHRVLIKQGLDAAQELEVLQQDQGGDGSFRRKSLGMDNVVTNSGVIRAEHYTINDEGRTVDLWLNDTILPTGIVRLRSAEGEMVLNTYGFGGSDARSLIAENPAADDSGGESQKAPGWEARAEAGGEDEPGSAEE